MAKEITFTLNTKVQGSWQSREGNVKFIDNEDKRMLKASFPSLEGLPLHELAIACVHNILEVEGWDPYQYLKDEKNGKQKGSSESKDPITFALMPNEVFWQSPDRSILLSVMTHGCKTHITLKPDDVRFGALLSATRCVPPRLQIIKDTSEAPNSAKPELIEQGFDRIAPNIMNKAKSMIALPYNDLVHQLAILVPKNVKEMNNINGRDTVSLARAILNIEESKGPGKSRSKILEMCSRVLTELGEFAVVEQKTESQSYTLVPNK